MTTDKKVARRKLSLLQLAAELQNVSKACKVMGYSRQQFYEIRRNYQTYGADGLLDRLPGAPSPHPNRVGEEVEKAILGQKSGDEIRGHDTNFAGRGRDGVRVGTGSGLDGVDGPA